MSFTCVALSLELALLEPSRPSSSVVSVSPVYIQGGGWICIIPAGIWLDLHDSVGTVNRSLGVSHYMVATNLVDVDGTMSKTSAAGISSWNLMCLHVSVITVRRSLGIGRYIVSTSLLCRGGTASRSSATEPVYGGSYYNEEEQHIFCLY